MKSTFVIVILISILSINIYSIERDSLLDVIKNSTNKAEKVKSLLSLSKLVRDADSAKSIEYCEDAIDIAEDLEDKVLLIKANTKLGITYKKYENFDKALEYFLEGLKISEKINNKVWETNCLNYLGSLYLNYNQNTKALKYYKESYRLAEEINDSVGLSNSLNNIGIVFWREKNLDSSVYYIQKSLVLSQDMKDSVGLISSYNNLGILHTDLGNYKRAFGYLNQSLAIAENQNDKWEIANILNNRAGLYLKLKDYSQIKEDLERAKRLAKEINSRILESDTYFIFSNYYSQVGEFEKSLEYYKMYSELSMELINEETTERIAAIQKDYELKAKDKDLDELSNKNDMQYLLIILLATSQILLIFLIFVYYRKLKENRRLTVELEKKNIDLEMLSNSKSKFFTLISHDLKAPLYNIGNLTSLLKMYYNDMEELERIETLDQLNVSSKQLLSLVDNILIWAQTQVGNVGNNPEKLNLKLIIRDSIDILTPLASEKGVEVVDRAEELLINVDENLLGTSIRNLISNAIKFSYSGSEVIIKSYNTESKINITVIDNGLGIEKERIDDILAGNANSTLGTNKEKGSGLGLRITKEFIEMIGGSLSIESEINVGTTFTIELPKQG